ncbi:uncharacterized protein [Periplaneta americana]|uniref:uncharacterized protein isoform X2 n=1 Tax=Periplaneta americana TaxID=6978 RepID=UPI0037E95EBF
MPSCFVPGCRAGYGGKAANKHFFTPPKDKDEFYKWARAIPRRDRPLSRTSSICNSHFSDDFIVKVDAFVVNNEKVELPRLKWKLKPGAVPHIFPKLPKYLSTLMKFRQRPIRKIQESTTPHKRKRKDEDYLPERRMTDIPETRVIMDVIKKEPGVDPLAIQSSDNADIDEKKPLSEEGNSLDLNMAAIKEDCIDYNCDLTGDIKLEETAVPVVFDAVKCEAKEGNSVDLDVAAIKTEYVDHSYDLTSETKVEETAVPTISLAAKCEAEDGNLFNLHVAGIKTECIDHSCNLKLEETAVPTDFLTIKCDAQEEWHDLDTVKEEATAEEGERIAGTNESTVPSKLDNIPHEEYRTICEITKNSLSSEKSVPTDEEKSVGTLWRIYEGL